MNTEINEEVESVIGFDPLYESLHKCRKGVLWKDSTASFYLNGLERTMYLSGKLHDGTYKARPPVHFMVTSPKPREISSIVFSDRVYQRSLNDNVVYPVMSKSFIYDNYACQKGKGTDAARNRLKEFLHKYYRKHGAVSYVSQFDIHGYYPNMSHAVTEDLFKKKLSPEIFEMVHRILNEQYEGDYGCNPGSQLIQIAGISVLDSFDHYVKEQLHAKLYIRYMDDFLIISHDKEYLEYCKTKMEQYLNQICFSLNPKKTRIYPLKDGIEFLGFRYILTDTGRVVMTIKSENVKRERRKLRRLVAKSKRGCLPREKVDESYKTWRNHASKGNSFKLLQRMDGYYYSLWRDGNDHY
jgi:hypothetical protein